MDYLHNLNLHSLCTHGIHGKLETFPFSLKVIILLTTMWYGNEGFGNIEIDALKDTALLGEDFYEGRFL